MKYIVVKTINNNVVLAKEPNTGEEAVLMAKGIAFGKRQGDFVEDDGIKHQIFKLWPDTKNVNNITYDKSLLQKTVMEICELAQKKSGISAKEIYQPLLDHISFSIDRIMFNLPMDNPFQSETYVLYAKEYEIAKEAVEHLEKKMKFSFGEAEIGFIALHLNSAIRKRSISTSLNHVQLYNKISNAIYNEFGENPEHEFAMKVFLMSIAEQLKINEANISVCMPWKEIVFKQAGESYILALHIAELVKNELKMELSSDSIGFITSDIEKLRQIYK